MRSLAALLVLASMPAVATTWSCGLTPAATQIVCTAEPAEDTAAPAEGVTPVVVRGTTFPLDARRTWFVDLWSPATDLPGVETLARLTICYRSPGCTVRWRHPALAQGAAPGP